MSSSSACWMTSLYALGSAMVVAITSGPEATADSRIDTCLWTSNPDVGPVKFAFHPSCRAASCSPAMVGTKNEVLASWVTIVMSRDGGALEKSSSFGGGISSTIWKGGASPSSCCGSWVSSFCAWVCSAAVVCACVSGTSVWVSVASSRCSAEQPASPPSAPALAAAVTCLRRSRLETPRPTRILSRPLLSSAIPVNT